MAVAFGVPFIAAVSCRRSFLQFVHQGAGLVFRVVDRTTGLFGGALVPAPGQGQQHGDTASGQDLFICLIRLSGRF
jgi:hypothetical protein